MKIYEFTYIDKLNLADEALNGRVHEFLFSECESQGWGHDFTFKQSSAPIKNESHTEYQFEVHGRFLTSESDDLDEEFSIQSKQDAGVAASTNSVI
jgi:hypothetical protein